MNPLALVLAAHLLGDWVFQTDWQARNKTTSWDAMARHVISYHVLIALALVAIDGPVWYRCVVLWVSMLTHAFLDRRWPVKWVMRHTGSGPFAELAWGVMCVDQALHISILALLVAPL